MGLSAVRGGEVGEETAAPRDWRAACTLGDRSLVGLEHSWICETSDGC